jgi:tetratricopeptide (TPR) repeat protein
MPEKTYMVVDPRRDHSIRVPRPDLSVKLGTPNACNRCHDDKDAKWSADWIVKWHGPDRARDVRHAETFAAARNDEPGVEKRLLSAVNDTESPAFTRASALLALRPYRSAHGFSAAIRSLKDPEPLVRVAAISKLEDWPQNELRRLLSPLLNDSARAVRTETARVLSPINKGELNVKAYKAYVRAYGELQKRFTEHLDRPESHLSLGIQAHEGGDLIEAKKRYRQSIRRDENFVPARVNLADLANREGNKAQAERLWREVTKLMPEWGDGFYSLGLLVAENPGRLKEASILLETAARKMPKHDRVHYNLGISLWQLGEKAKGARFLIQAGKIAPSNPEYPFGLAQFYVQDKNWRAALPHARRAAELAPTNPDVHRLLFLINSKLK